MKMYLAIKIRDFPASNHVSFPGGGSYTVRIRRLNMETFKHEATFKNDISSRLPSFSTSKPLSFSGKKYLEPGALPWISRPKRWGFTPEKWCLGDKPFRKVVEPTPSEKYARQIGSFPQIGWKYTWNHHLVSFWKNVCSWGELLNFREGIPPASHIPKPSAGNLLAAD